MFEPVSVSVPDRQLLPWSVCLSVKDEKFSEWSPTQHGESYGYMRRIVDFWKNHRSTDQYLIYGKIDSTSFKWEMVPYERCRTFIGRIIQQVQVLWRTVFGGVALSQETRNRQDTAYNSVTTLVPKKPEPSDAPSKSSDAFCKDETIDRQWVLKGDKVNVLFNYAPIGFGGERLHFLVVPKEHRKGFTDVTQDEYCESMALTKKLVDHFTTARKTVKNVYLLNKTGVDAGQTVDHWHLHVIFTNNAAQDFWGKITVFKNILLGSSPMKKDELAKKVDGLRQELSRC